MNIIWNIIKKDFRHCRWLLLLLATVWLIKACLMYQVSDPPGANNITQPTQRIFFEPVALNGATVIDMISLVYELPRLPAIVMLPLLAVWFSDIFLLMGITLRVLREDSAVMGLSFWRTRPINRGHMLAAKAIFLGMIAFPLQYLLQGWVGKLIYDRVDIHFVSSSLSDLWWGGLRDMLLIQVCCLAAAVVVATLWRSRIVGVGTLLLSTAAVMLLRVEASPETGHRLQEVTGFLLLYTGLFGTVLIAAYMYLKANQVLGFSLYGAGLAVMLIIVMFQ